MRDANAVVDEVIDLWDRGASQDETGGVIEADRIEAKLEALRELLAFCFERAYAAMDEGSEHARGRNAEAIAIATHINSLIASLESARGTRRGER